MTIDEMAAEGALSSDCGSLARQPGVSAALVAPKEFITAPAAPAAGLRQEICRRHQRVVSEPELVSSLRQLCQIRTHTLGELEKAWLGCQRELDRLEGLLQRLDFLDGNLAEINDLLVSGLQAKA